MIRNEGQPKLKDYLDALIDFCPVSLVINVYIISNQNLNYTMRQKLYRFMGISPSFVDLGTVKKGINFIQYRYKLFNCFSTCTTNIIIIVKSCALIMSF